MKHVRDGNIVSFGRARFSLYTERLIRFEYSDDQVFELRKTLAVSNREFDTVDFSVMQTGDTLELRTKYITVRYANDGNKFSKDNLSVSYNHEGFKFEWFPELEGTGNLGATNRTLDGYSGAFNEDTGEAIDLGEGLISRDGWAVIDDSANVLIDGETNWVTPRTQENCADLYLFAYGLDFKAALLDGSKLIGSQPIPPRYAFGYWWSRYWAYTDTQIEDLVDQFDSMKLPIDVMVVDMDWHLEGWTGYTWDRRYFPDPDDFLRELQKRDLKITLNLHPADGVAKHEEQFDTMANAMGLDPEKVDKVEFDITDPKYMGNYFKHLHHPDEKRGVDFWWMDWQQGSSTQMKGLDTLPWINHLHWEDMRKNKERENKRPLIFSRFGGAGAGRYAIGFSGDTTSNWESLEFQPHFTSTASNILYGYWSHDIGGHMPGPIEPELYTRWMQFGLYSPILRTHTTKEADAERRFWEYPAPYSNVMMDVIKDRYNMVPYIYTEARKCYDTGISLCRPMYYDYPQENDAYVFSGQYMFGDEMLVAPIVTQASKETDMAEMEIWLPEGEWFDISRGCVEHGGRAISRSYTIDEVPVFVKPGTVIPGQMKAVRLNAKCYKNLSATIYPGESGSYDLYEDDGITQDYTNNNAAVTSISHHKDGNTRIIEVSPSLGSYEGFEKERSLTLYLEGAEPVAQIKYAGKELDYNLRLEDGELGWKYDGIKARVQITIPNFDITSGLKVVVEYQDNISEGLMNGFKGIMNRLDKVNNFATMTTIHKVLDSRERDSVEAAQTGNRLSRKPDSAVSELENLARLIKDLPAGLKALAEARSDCGPKMEYYHKSIALLKDIESIMLRSKSI